MLLRASIHKHQRMRPSSVNVYMDVVHEKLLPLHHQDLYQECVLVDSASPISSQAESITGMLLR